jgi:hypothetical protein
LDQESTWGGGRRVPARQAANERASELRGVFETVSALSVRAAGGTRHRWPGCGRGWRCEPVQQAGNQVEGTFCERLGSTGPARTTTAPSCAGICTGTAASAWA